MELSCVLKSHHAFWLGPCPSPSCSRPCLGGGGCLGHTVEQGQAHIPAAATPQRVPGGHPLPISLWDKAWLAEGYPLLLAQLVTATLALHLRREAPCTRGRCEHPVPQSLPGCVLPPAAKAAF